MCAKTLTEKVLQAVEKWVPKRTVKEKKSMHQWLNERVMKLVAEKHDAEGTEKEKEAAEACSKGVLEEYKKHFQRNSTTFC